MNWPVRDEWIATLVSAIFFALIVVLVRVTADSTLSAFLAFVALLVCSWKMWIPISFTLGPRGISSKSILGNNRLAWREIDHYKTHRRGVMLYCTENNSPLANLRSIYIATSEPVEELQQLIDYYQELRRTGTGSSILRHADTGSTQQQSKPKDNEPENESPSHSS
ncbi:MAG: hypothetical protein COA78_05180 [Blastopirellula sp.]|nr:MAG: hypothetical protein COA78_05180 [Blastopirellula sp.]